MIGDKIYVKLFGEQVEVIVPPAVKDKDRIVLENKGYISNTGLRGKLIINLKVTPPKEISERERKIYEQLLRVEKQKGKEK